MMLCILQGEPGYKTDCANNNCENVSIEYAII